MGLLPNHPGDALEVAQFGTIGEVDSDIEPSSDRDVMSEMDEEAGFTQVADKPLVTGAMGLPILEHQLDIAPRMFSSFLWVSFMLCCIHHSLSSVVSTQVNLL
jgi:hypothetical protein